MWRNALVHAIQGPFQGPTTVEAVPVDIRSQRLGHADGAVTLKVYAHVMPGDDEAAAAAANGRVRDRL